MPGIRAPSRPAGPPASEPSEVRDALARVTASEAFRGAPQLASFLTYIVGMALDGRAGEIKGYTIATQALGRDADFDPQTDPIVRVEAMRLRRALEAYYAEAGSGDRLRIVIPRGSYVPVFEPVAPVAAPVAPEPAGDAPAPEPSPAAPAPAAPSPVPAARGVSSPPPTSRLPWGVAAALAVAALGVTGFALLRPAAPAAPGAAPLAAASGFEPRLAVVLAEGEAGPDAARLREDLVDALAAFDEVAVTERPDGVADERGAYRVVLRVHRRAGAPVAQARLVAGGGRVVWTREARLDDEGAAGRLAAALAQPYGVVHADLRHQGEPGQSCLVETYDHWRAPTAGRHARARACLEAAVARDPGASLPRAHLARILLEEPHLSGKPAGDAVERAWRQAREALALRPESARAHGALMGALFAKGDPEGALAAGRRAVEANPLDSDLRAAFADHLVAAGRFAEGGREMAAALAGSPAPPAWYEFTLFVAALMQGQDAAAREIAGRIDPAECAGAYLARAVVAKAAGDLGEARREIALLMEQRPEWRAGFMRELGQRLQNRAAQARFEAELGPLLPAALAGRAPG